MKVILQENVDNLGYVGDILDVADGYARNFLLPRKKAAEANPRNVKALEHAKRVTGHKAKQVEEGMKGEAEKLSGVSLTFEVKAGKDGKLFGSITSKDIEERLLADGFEVDRRKIQLGQPLKELGTSAVAIKLFREISAQISVTLVKQGGDEAAAKNEDSESAEENESTETPDSDTESSQT
ncbi:50S ribosomal protein L9 [Candidatus Nitronereus thalassa]|uniref:Large ribosomal subunit protein bL9 n=1 Tax=Candidatus Nitronereus thalassa TaxID=3020898 RepID=A0ABU3K6W9_9BACT|nr:50S ribosomal protein L9 [Candidatus Nitronereus thalassa]MDT7042095.1 50S ribosomal protein L9 [Candidatus Nitronereus thalassa]